jgi:hypothetical protein
MSFNVASKIVKDVTRHPQKYNLPTIISAKAASGGVVHLVWKLETEKGRFYLKIRGNKFAKIPEIATSPDNIAYEYKALMLLGNLMPDNFPQVVHFDQENAFMITTDAMPQGVSFEALLNAGKVTSSMIENLGKILKAIHEAVTSICESIRENEDKDFFLEKLEHKLAHSNHPILNDIIKELTWHQPRQIIIGDPSPKNIGVNNNGARFIFFDLEDVHRGNVVFDVGFLIGHLILHAYNSEQQAIVRVKSFLNGYGIQRPDNRLIKAIALGTIMYRLNSIVPYSIELSDQQKSKLLQTITAVLMNPDLGSILWHELIPIVLREG